MGSGGAGAIAPCEGFCGLVALPRVRGGGKTKGGMLVGGGGWPLHPKGGWWKGEVINRSELV